MKPRRRLPVLAAALAGLLLAACTSSTGRDPGPEAVACAETFATSRCAAITERAAAQPGIDPSAITDILIVPFDGVAEDGTIVTLGGAPSLEVRVVFADGTTRDLMLGCGGLGDPSDPVCTDDPHLRAASVTMGGYFDVPCQSEEPSSCATHHPDIDPDVARQSEPIAVERVDIPITAVGRTEVPLGTGSLPNGILTEASFSFVDDWPDGITWADGRVLLEVRSLEPDGTPFDNYYLHGWRDGVESIEAVLVFDVTRFEPGAVLMIRDVVVR